MAATFSLHFQDRQFSAKQIKQLSPDSLPQDSFQQLILQFCRSWLNGQEHFQVHTSGSTGAPKPITLSRAQMIASARQTIEALGLREGDKALLCINAAYIGGKMMLVRAMEHRLQLTALEAEANPLLKLSEENRFDFTALVPLQLESILQNPHSRSILDKMKAVIIGGAPVSETLRRQLQQVSAPTYSTYGMTETVSHIALKRLNGPDAPEYFTAFKDLNLGQDERGCLNILGKVSGGELVQTNDVVQLLDSHRFIWLGRADNIINSGGVKIQLEKIDRLASSLLAQLGQQRNLFAWGLPDERLGQQLVLIVEGDPLPEQTETMWKQQLLEKLVRYERPGAIFYLPEFKETPSAKIQKAATAALITKNDS